MFMRTVQDRTTGRKLCEPNITASTEEETLIIETLGQPFESVLFSHPRLPRIAHETSRRWLGKGSTCLAAGTVGTWNLGRSRGAAKAERTVSKPRLSS